MRVAEFPRQHLAQGADEGRESADDLGAAAGGKNRRPGGRANVAHHASERPAHAIVPFELGVGPVAPEPSNGGDDHARRRGGERLRPEPPVVQNHRRALGQAAQPRRILHIKGDACLVGAEIRMQGAVLRWLRARDERRFAPGLEAAPRRLHVHDLGAVVRKQLAAIAAGDAASDVEHLEAGQRTLLRRAEFSLHAADSTKTSGVSWQDVGRAGVSLNPCRVACCRAWIGC